VNLLVAMDAFKGTLSAPEACAVVARGLRSVLSGAYVMQRPMADGGEGTGATIHAAAGGRWVGVPVTGPLPDRVVDAAYLWIPGDDPEALVEMARASGKPVIVNFLGSQESGADNGLRFTDTIEETAAATIPRGAIHERNVFSLTSSAEANEEIHTEAGRAMNTRIARNTRLLKVRLVNTSRSSRADRMMNRTEMMRTLRFSLNSRI